VDAHSSRLGEIVKRVYRSKKPIDIRKRSIQKA
jgi:hypothetical protein